MNQKFPRSAQIMSDDVPGSLTDSPLSPQYSSPDEDCTVPYWDLLWVDPEERASRYAIGLSEQRRGYLINRDKSMSADPSQKMFLLNILLLMILICFLSKKALVRF